MSIDQTSGHYWLLPVISGRLVVNWSIKLTMVSLKKFCISYLMLLVYKHDIKTNFFFFKVSIENVTFLIKISFMS